MQENKNLNVIINGLVKENPTFCSAPGYVPHTGGHHLSEKRFGHGAFRNGGAGCL